MAKPAFAAVGFLVTERETVQLGGENFKRAVMVKLLPKAEVSPVDRPTS
jgi:hypothetical protein